MADTPRGRRVQVWSVIALGSAAALEAVWRLATDPVGAQWWVLAALTVLSSSIAVKVPLVPATMSVSGDLPIYGRAALWPGPSHQRDGGTRGLARR
jgi:hypothetical protein